MGTAPLRQRSPALHGLAVQKPSSVEKEVNEMDNTTLIRIVAGILFVIVLVILIQRRRTRVR